MRFIIEEEIRKSFLRQSKEQEEVVDGISDSESEIEDFILLYDGYEEEEITFPENHDDETDKDFDCENKRIINFWAEISRPFLTLSI